MHTDPALIDAYRHTARAVRREQARNEFIDVRVGELICMFDRDPAQPIAAIFAYGPRVEMREDVVAFAIETDGSPDLLLGRALTCPLVRRDLVARYALARAEVEADRLANEFDYQEG